MQVETSAMPISVTQQKIRHLLAATLKPVGGVDVDRGAVADAAIQAWLRAAAELGPLIGTEGVRAVYARCLLLAREAFPWLPPAEITTSQVKALGDLREALEGRGPPQAYEAITALLFNVADLLARMIGESLTIHLLDTAWGHEIPDPTHKEFPT
jgi:hypothetical protein